MQEKEQYFVFLDIDGTLWDMDYNSDRYSNVHYVEWPKLKPGSIKALKTLLYSLEQEYDTVLVISSKRREDIDDCKEYLKANKFVFNKPLEKIESPSIICRGNSILNFMKNRGKAPFTYAESSNIFARLFSRIKDEDYKNYVVLEDEKHLLGNYIPKNRIIMSDHNKQSINLKQVEKYLRNNNINIAYPNAEEFI